MSKFVLGIDVGGTNIKMGLVSFSGKLIYRTLLATKTFMRSKKHLTDVLIEGSIHLIQHHRLTKKDILGIGIGLPGLVNHARGVVHVLTNIPGWKNVPLKSICEKKINIPVFIDNDVNVMTLGEWRYGAGKGFDHLVCITLGTGVGGGLVLNGQLYRGQGWSAGEIGHIPLNEKGPVCKCGGYGCLERCVGSSYLVEKAKKYFGKKQVSLEQINDWANQGNPKALRFWQETAEHIGNALVGVVNLLNPGRIIIGGGIANAHRHLFKPIEQVIKRRSMKIPALTVKIVKARLDENAAIIGAQVLVKDAIS